MNSHNISNSFDEDIFSSSSLEDNIECNINTPKENETEHLINMCKELKLIFNEKLQNTSVDEVEKLLFKTEMPKLQETFSNILISIKSKLENINSDIISEVSCLLQYTIDLLSCVLIAVKFIKKKIELEKVQSLPIVTCDMLFQTFEHCKNSDTIYGIYFEKMSSSLTSLFKKANEVQNNFLNILNNNIVFDITQVNHIATLVSVVDLLVQVGITVTALDIKTSADLWKQFIIFNKKYKELLILRLDVAVPVNFFASEIMSNVDIIMKMEKENDIRAADKNLKIASFNLKLIITLCDIYKDNLGNFHEKILELLISLHRYSIPYLQFIGFNKELINSVQIYLTAGTAPLIGHMIGERQFVQTYFTNISKYLHDNETKLGGIFLSIAMISKLLMTNSDTRRLWLRNEEDCNIIYTIFSVIDKCHFEFTLNLQIAVQGSPGESNHKCSLYEYLLIHTVAVIISLDNEQFMYSEKLILQSVLQTEAWKAMFANDIWSVIARYGSAELCNRQLNLLLDIYNQYLSDCRNRPEKMYLSNTLSKLFSFLTSEHQLDVLKKYPLLNCPKTWTTLQILQYTNLQYDIKAEVMELTKICTDKIHNFLEEKFTMKDYNQMCDYMELLSTYKDINEANNLQKKFTNALFKLWLLNFSDECVNSTWLQEFINICVDLSVTYVKYFNNAQLLQILRVMQKLKEKNDAYKLMITKFLRALSKVYIKESSEQISIFNSMQELFKYLLKDSNPVVKQKTLETFDYFAHHASHTEILSSIVGTDPKLQNELTSYLRKIVKSTSENDYLGKQNYTLFLHKCDIKSISIEPQKKKFKSTSDINIDFVIQRLDFDSDTVTDYYKNNNISNEQKDKMICIINKLNTVL